MKKKKIIRTNTIGDLEAFKKLYTKINKYLPITNKMWIKGDIIPHSSLLSEKEGICFIGELCVSQNWSYQVYEELKFFLYYYSPHIKQLLYAEDDKKSGDINKGFYYTNMHYNKNKKAFSELFLHNEGDFLKGYKNILRGISFETIDGKRIRVSTDEEDKLVSQIYLALYRLYLKIEAESKKHPSPYNAQRDASLRAKMVKRFYPMYLYLTTELNSTQKKARIIIATLIEKLGYEIVDSETKKVKYITEEYLKTYFNEVKKNMPTKD